jgi:sirohydrochlorin ferrochelatase
VKEALLVMVHGSPHAAANDDVFAVVDDVRQRDVYPIVEVGFMDCNKPTIPEAIQTCLEQGAEKVIGVPYFLHLGKHVANDLPALLEQAQLQHPEVEFWMGDFLGQDALVADVICDRVAEVTDDTRPAAG